MKLLLPCPGRIFEANRVKYFATAANYYDVNKKPMNMKYDKNLFFNHVLYKIIKLPLLYEIKFT